MIGKFLRDFSVFEKKVRRALSGEWATGWERSQSYQNVLKEAHVQA
jgi:hypothetical protein